MTVSKCARCRDDATCIAAYTSPGGRVVEYLDDRCAAALPADVTITQLANRLIAPGSQRKNAA
jgi:hypothetical protein